MQFELTAVYRKTSEGYLGLVEELPGANTYGPTLEATRAKLREVVALVLAANRAFAEHDLEDSPDLIREPFDWAA
ncbi:MAG TPA: type II toxin-antitoxin system HicB family antitoxin [Thermoanaerobaculia bacterium]